MTVQIRQVAQSTYSLDCGQDPIFSINQVGYLLVDDMPVLIDPGSTSAASAMLDNSSKFGFDLEDLSYIILTHIHVDHAGGAGYLAQRLPKAKVVLHPRGVGHMVDPSRLVRNFGRVFGENFEEILGPILPVPRDRMLVVEDGEVIRLGQRDLKMHFSPGHAPHHLAIQDTLTRGLFCGDALGFISDSTPEIPFPVGLPPFDPEAYLESIENLASLRPRIIFYAHHGARSDVDHLVRRVKEICTAFVSIIKEAVEAEEDVQKISDHILEYVKGFSQEAELPIIVEASVSGYVEYFKKKN